MIVGSTYFFRDFEDFKSKDIDIVIFKKNDSIYNFYMQKKEHNKDVFIWNPDAVFSYDYKKNPMAVGKFLVTEVLTELGVSFEDVIPLLEEHLPNVTQRHNYQRLIFAFYKQNGEMTLTESQLLEVYNDYKLNKKR